MENKNSLKTKITKYSFVLCTLLPMSSLLACKQKASSNVTTSSEDESPVCCPNCDKGLRVISQNCPYCGFYLGSFSSSTKTTAFRNHPKHTPTTPPESVTTSLPEIDRSYRQPTSNFLSGGVSYPSTLPNVHIPQPSINSNSSFSISFGSGALHGDPFHNDELTETENLLFDTGESTCDKIDKIADEIEKRTNRRKKQWDADNKESERRNELKRREQEEHKRNIRETEDWIKENEKRRERHNKIFEKYMKNIYDSRKRKEITPVHWEVKKDFLEEKLEFIKYMLSEKGMKKWKTEYVIDCIKKTVPKIHSMQKEVAKKYLPIKHSLDPRVYIGRQDEKEKTIKAVEEYQRYAKHTLKSMEEILTKFNGNKEKINFEPYTMPPEEEKKEILAQEEELNQIWQESREHQKMITKEYSAVKNFDNEEHFGLLYNSYVQLSSDISSRLPLPSSEANYLYDREDSEEMFLLKTKAAKSPLAMYAHYTGIHVLLGSTDDKGNYTPGKVLNDDEFIPILTKILEKKNPNIHRYALNYADLMRRKCEMLKEPQKAEKYKSLIEFNLNIDMKGASLINFSIGGRGQEPSHSKKSLLSFSLSSPLIDQAIGLINSNFGEILQRIFSSIESSAEGMTLSSYTIEQILEKILEISDISKAMNDFRKKNEKCSEDEILNTIAEEFYSIISDAITKISPDKKTNLAMKSSVKFSLRKILEK